MQTMSRPPVFARIRLPGSRGLRAGAAAGVLAVLGALAVPAQPALAADDPAQVRQERQRHGHRTLFNGGDERIGRTVYHSFRVPSLVRTKQGSLLAFAEGRVRDDADHGDIDLVYKRSTDAGLSWSRLRLVAGEGRGTWGNPTAVADRKTGEVFLFMSWNPATVSQFGRDGTVRITRWGQRRVMLTSSRDDGRSWSRPKDLTPTLLPKNRDWDAIGPGNGIQTVAGPRPGRLIVPALSRNIWSDDHGRTWRSRRIPGGTSEGTITELLDGTLVRNDRAVGQVWPAARARMISRGTIEDGFRAFVPNRTLPDARVAGSAIRYGRDPSRLLFLNPANAAERCSMTVRLSYDEARTWPIGRRTGERAARSRACGNDQGGYSSMAVAGNRLVGALIEFIDRPETGSNRSIEFHRFNLAWVVDGAREPVRSVGQSVRDDRQAGVAPPTARPAAPAQRPRPSRTAEEERRTREPAAEPSRPAARPAAAAAAPEATRLPAAAPAAAGTSPPRAGGALLAGLLLLALVLPLVSGRVRPRAARRAPDSVTDRHR